MNMKHRMRVLVVLLVLGLSSVATIGATSASNAAEANQCLTIASTYDGFNHWSLLDENASIVGTDLTVRSTCDEVFEVWVNGRSRQGGEYLLSMEIPLETTRIEIKFSNSSIVYDNLTVFPSGDFTSILEEKYSIPDPITISASDFESSKAWIVLRSAMILWFIVTVISWKIVNYYFDRFHCEELVN
jgi:hypothetical protein